MINLHQSSNSTSRVLRRVMGSKLPRFARPIVSQVRSLLRPHRIATHMKRIELLELYDAARGVRPGGKILEVGSYLGASTVSLCAGATSADASVVCVDTWNNETMPEGLRDTFPEFTKNVAKYSHMISVVRKQSVQLTERDLPEEINVLFLDGDHSYETISYELNLLLPRVPNGSTVALHDVLAFEGPQHAMADYISRGRLRLVSIVENLALLRAC